MSALLWAERDGGPTRMCYPASKEVTMAVAANKHAARGLLTLAVVVLLAGLVPPLAGGNFWEKKPAATWTLEEALKVVQDSPWAHEELVVPPGWLRGRGANRNAAWRNRHNDPLLQGAPERRMPRPSRGPVIRRDEFPRAGYLVRWESARPVVEAFARLKELGERASANFQSPPPRLPEDRYVITVKTTRPPPRGPDLFDRLGKKELRERARLKTQRGRVAPVEVERSGLGANAAVHFFFARSYEGEPLLRPAGEKVEFRFEGRRFTLKTKFALKGSFLR